MAKDHAHSRARYESRLHQAHYALWQAQEEAGLRGDFGATEDIDAMLRHVETLMADSLANKGPRPASQLFR